MGVEIILHLGAHKTASTHLQLALKRARPLPGVAVFVPDDLRKGGLRLQDWLQQGVEDTAHQAALRRAFAVTGRLVISEENILGQCPGAVRPVVAGLYPHAPDRLRKLGQVLPEGRVTLALAVREGAGFLASAYAQALMAGRIAPFAQLCGHVDPAAIGWEDLLAALMAAMPGARAVVWDHADWPEVAPQVGRALLGPDAAPLRPGPGLAHPGLSAPAVAALLAAAPATPEAARAMALDLRRRHPKEGGHPPYEPFDAATRARARAAHACALARLAARPGVTVLRAG